MGKPKPAAGIDEALGQGIRLGFQVVAQEFDNPGDVANHGLFDASFPVLEGFHVDAQLPGKVLLEVKFQAALPDVFADGFWGGGGRLSGDPIIRAGATQPLDVQMTNWQRTPPRPSSSTMRKAVYCTIMNSGWKSSPLTLRPRNTTTIARARTTPMPT